MTKTLVVALSAMVLTGGCSLVLQERPLESTFGFAKKRCSTSSKYWIADALIAGATGATVIGARVYADSAAEDDTALYSAAGLGAVLAVAYLASAGTGRHWISACHEQWSTDKTDP
ncbi:MAG: hypothetical protein AB7T06_09025 [Kofleriaceae bacterium]